ncbi:MAG: replicative DNA helicase [Pseudomonadota bacterium]|nr:replicative DNA helicase [Pseudomonadota bacterium]
MSNPAENNVEQNEYLPHNIDAEQALLGALLVDNESFEAIFPILKEHHFFDPLHARIFSVIAEKIQRNSLASPVTLKSYFEGDEALAEMGGASYLVRLASSGISTFAAKEFANLIKDMSLRRSLMNLGHTMSEKAKKVSLENGPEEQIVQAEQALYTLSSQGETDTGFKSFVNATREAIEIASKAYKRDGGLSGLSTGLIDLDKKLGGLNPSDLVIIAGRPSMGKTALATNIAFNVARNYQKNKSSKTPDNLSSGVVGFFSLEMSSSQLASRILSEVSKVPSDQIRRGELSEREFRKFIEAAQQLQDCTLFIDDTAALPISSLTSRARRLKRTYGLDLLIVDYLQLVRPVLSKDNRVNEISEITQGLKAIAKELDIPVIALSQLSRQVETREDKRPQLSDLRESGSIEQDSDVVLFVFREEYYKEREKPSDHEVEAIIKWQDEMSAVHGKAEIIIGKQRHGPIGTVDLSFESQYTKFGNLAKMHQQKSNTQ